MPAYYIDTTRRDAALNHTPAQEFDTRYAKWMKLDSHVCLQIEPRTMTNQFFVEYSATTSHLIFGRMLCLRLLRTSHIAKHLNCPDVVVELAPQIIKRGVMDYCSSNYSVPPSNLHCSEHGHNDHNDHNGDF